MAGPDQVEGQPPETVERIRADLRAEAARLDAAGQPERAHRLRAIANESDESLVQRQAQLETAEESAAELAAEDAQTPEGREQARREDEDRESFLRGETPANAFITTAKDRAALEAQRVQREGWDASIVVQQARVVGRIGTAHRGRTRERRPGTARVRGSRRNATRGSPSSSDDPDESDHDHLARPRPSRRGRR